MARCRLFLLLGIFCYTIFLKYILLFYKKQPNTFFLVFSCHMVMKLQLSLNGDKEQWRLSSVSTYQACGTALCRVWSGDGVANEGRAQRPLSREYRRYSKRKLSESRIQRSAAISNCTSPFHVIIHSAERARQPSLEPQFQVRRCGGRGGERRSPETVGNITGNWNRQDM